MELIINNQKITEPIDNIIYELKREANWRVFKEIQVKENYLRVTCPWHKDGNETKPSCSIYTSYDSDSIMPGTCHCFTCNAKYQLYQLVAFVLDISDEEAKNWLVSKYGSLNIEEDLQFDKWQEESVIKSAQYLDESILDNFRYYHPYVEQRGISFDVVKKFLIGFNEEKQTITFPIWDENNHLVMITERSINSKQFYIPEGVEKPVYLLNFILNDMYNGIKYPFIIVTEGQFDALTSWTYGIPCVATCGSLSQHQIEVLKNSGIKTFVTMFDNDTAGRNFTKKFKQGMKKDQFIIDNTINIPNKKDINDLTKEEFYYLLQKNNIL